MPMEHNGSGRKSSHIESFGAEADADRWLPFRETRSLRRTQFKRQQSLAEVLRNREREFAPFEVGK